MMTTTQSPPNFQAKIHKVSLPGRSDDDAMTALIRDILQTREVRQFLITLAPQFLDVWAEKSKWKNKISRLTGVVVKNQLSRPEDALKKSELPLLFENDRFVQRLMELLPGVINGLTDAVCASGRTLETLSADEKKTRVGTLLSRTRKGRTGEILTSCFRILNDIHKEDPEFLAQTLAPGFKKWLESTDFGELKEAVDNSGSDGRALVEMINNTIWEYPAKADTRTTLKVGQGPPYRPASIMRAK